MRADLLASFAARRKARPTAAAKLREFSDRALAFAGLAPISLTRRSNCRTPPRNLPAAGRHDESSPSLARTGERRQPAAGHARPGAHKRRCLVMPAAPTLVADTPFQCGIRLASRTEADVRKTSR